MWTFNCLDYFWPFSYVFLPFDSWCRLRFFDKNSLPCDARGNRGRESRIGYYRRGPAVACEKLWIGGKQLTSRMRAGQNGPDDFPPSGLLTLWNIKTMPLWCKQKGSVEPVDFFLALICQFCKARCVNQIVELFELGDLQISCCFPRLYGQPAADCKRERKYVTGGLLNTEETTAVFFTTCDEWGVFSIGCACWIN